MEFFFRKFKLILNKTMKKITLALLLLSSFFAIAQRTCGMEENMQRIMADPAQKAAYLQMQEKFEVELEKLQNTEYRSAQSINAEPTRIPVAVHYPSGANLTAAVKTCLRNLAQRQINILNADYNGANTDISNWAGVSANYPGTLTGNLNVEFVLATQNHPSGTGLVNGEVAVTFGTDYLSGADSDATWAGYCNLVVRNISGGVLGYSPLGGYPSAGMTVVIDNNAFGASMIGSTPSTCSGYVPGAPYNKGRTLTHELGHFFNLNHTFAGCDGPNCATSGDRVCDTPSTDEARYDCNAANNPPPPGGNNPPVSSCGPLQLTMNYMDYVEDGCMYMFTKGQETRMKAWYNTISSQLTTNTLSNTNFVKSNYTLAPNPNNGSFTLTFKDLSNDVSVEVFDISGRVVYENYYTQSANLVQDIKIENPSSGLYFVNIKSGSSLSTEKIIIK